jgi:hypothetical protein
MPEGFVELPKSEGGSGADFFDPKDGDTVILKLLRLPYVLFAHKLPDPANPFGKQIPCGAEERNACPICEDTTGAYDSKAKRATNVKAYYPAFVVSVKHKDGTKETINAPRVISGGTRLHEGFTACYGVLAEFGGNILDKVLVLTRTGADASTSYSVQVFPDPEFKPEIPGDLKAPDGKEIALKWLEKVWKEMGYDPFQGNAAPAGDADANAKDPFEELEAVS